MPDPNKEKDQPGPVEVEFFHEFDPGYRILACNGVWGVLTARGDIKLDFYVEGLKIPERITSLVNPDGTIGPGTNPPPPRIVRRIQVGVLINLPQAEYMSVMISEIIKKLKEKFPVQGK
jgi:hypothetical protein